jgi:activator of 2-hydroxyglutaryl-CoA dehydratase
MIKNSIKWIGNDRINSIIRWYVGVTGYGRSTVSAGSKEQVPRVFSPTVTAEVQLLRVRRRRCENTVITGYGRGPVTAGSKCEVTVITGYGSTQDDEHLCGEKGTEPVVCTVTSAQRHNYVRDATYMYLVS